jgi:pimeloyl-ACP methyl ester carboxylesterase
MYLGGSPFDLPGLFSILPYGELAFGLWLPKGGIYGVVEGIAKLARELGVELYTNTRVNRILTERGQVQGLELADGTRQLASIVVSNVDVPTTNTALLQEPALQPKLQKQTDRMKMTPGVLTFYWGVRGPVKNIGHHTIFLPNEYASAFDDLFKHKRIPQNLPFYVAVPSATDPALAPVGDTAMFVLVPTPLLSELGEVDLRATTRAIKQQVFERLWQHGVELDPERIVVEETYTPEDWRARFGLHDGSAFGAAHTLFQVGPFRARNYSSDIAGLFYTGASTTPGTGMPMVLLSGKLTAERVQTQLAVRSRGMFVKRYGNGPRAFLGWHGWSGDHRTFEPLLRYLPAEVSFYSVDLPGYGQSPPPLGEWNLTTVAEEIGATIDKLAVERFTLVGNCSGALLGLQAVPSRLARIERLVLLDAFAFVPWYFRLFIEKPFGTYAYYSTFANPLGRWITNLSLARHRAAATDLTGSFGKVDHTVSLRYLELLASIGGIERFRDVHAPTDIVYGARSFQAVKASVAMWQALWPHAKSWELAVQATCPSWMRPKR